MNTDDRPPKERSEKDKAARRAAAVRVKPFEWKKGQSGNPAGGRKTVDPQPKTLAEVAALCRRIATAPATIAAIKKILLDKKNPKLQVEAWRIFMERGFGAPLQAILLQDQVRVAEAQAAGGGQSALLPSPFEINPDDPRQVARATAVAQQLLQLGMAAGLDDQRFALARDRDRRTLPEVEAELAAKPAQPATATEPRKVVELRRGPDRFDPNGARFETISAEEQKRIDKRRID